MARTVSPLASRFWRSSVPKLISLAGPPYATRAAPLTRSCTSGNGRGRRSDTVQRYAFEREEEHRWAVGETDQALKSLSARTSPVPRDNLRRWELWAE
jgi:hypothetical protein